VPVLAQRGLRADLLSRPIGFGRGGTSAKAARRGGRDLKHALKALADAGQ
jgi:hypothetical protein